MRKCAAAIVAAVLAPGVLLSPARADDSSCRNEVDVILDRFTSGLGHRDEIGALSIASPDSEESASVAVPGATLRYSDGTTMSIDEWREMVKKGGKALESISSRYKILELEAEGPRAVVTYTITHTYTLKKDSPLKYISVSRWRTMLAKTRQGWRLKSFVQLSQETTCDGRPASPEASVPKW